MTKVSSVTCGCKIGVDIIIGFFPDGLGPSRRSHGVQVVGEIRGVWIRIVNGNVVDLRTQVSKYSLQQSEDSDIHTSTFPAKGDSTYLLQKLCALEQIESDPPL